MNYRHAFHAGGFADVHKHAVLVLLIEHLRKKETPFCVLDTHAGTGRYDLDGSEAARTGEAADGIRRLLAGEQTLPDALDAYVGALRDANPAWPAIRTYPGSPSIIRSMLRPQDRLIAVELHPEDAHALKRLFANDRQVAVHEADGYGALKAHLPPGERRGLVLIDPPFEERDELRHLSRALPEALRRWKTGIFAIWYPIKDSAAAEKFRAEIAGLRRPARAAEFYRFPPDDPERLNGSGVAIVNPPWQLDQALSTLQPILAQRLGAAGGTRIIELTAANPI